MKKINKYKLLKLKWVISHFHLLYLLMYFIFNCFFDGCPEKNLLLCLLEREIKPNFLPFIILKHPIELVAIYYLTQTCYVIYSIQSVMEIFKESNYFKDRSFPLYWPPLNHHHYELHTSHIFQKRKKFWKLDHLQPVLLAVWHQLNTQSEMHSIFSHSDAHICVIL